MSNSWLQHPTTSNLLKKSYIKTFIDVSGDMYVRNANIDGFSSDISMNGTITCDSLTLTESTGAGINSDVQVALNTKQNTIVTGTGITISSDTINASGGGVINVTESSSTTFGSWTQRGSTQTPAASNQSISGMEGFYGNAVKLSGDGNTLLVGAPLVDLTAYTNNPGAIYLYKWTWTWSLGSHWSRKGTLDQSYPLAGEANSDSIGFHGHGMTLNHTGSVIAFSKTYNGGQNYVKVFNISYSGIATQKGSTLRGTQGTWYQNNWRWSFGSAIKLSTSGNRLVVTASWVYPSSGVPWNKPKILIYDWNGIDWVLHSNFQVDGDTPTTRGTLAINSTGTVIGLGMSFSKIGGNAYAGVARVYEYDGSNWVQKGSDIGPDQNVAYQFFGDSVAMNADGNTFGVASNNGALSTQYINIYDWNGSAWVQRGPRCFDVNRLERISDDGNIVGGWTYTPREGRVVQWNGTSWSLMNSGLTMPMFLGFAMSATGTRVAAGNHVIPSTARVYSIGTTTTNSTDISGTLFLYGASLNVIGNISVSGSTVHTSDIREKTNIMDITNALSTLLKLEPEIYDKGKAINQMSDLLQKESGFIAQKIWYNIPELRHLVILPEGVNPDDIQDISMNRTKPVHIDIYDISTNGFINKDSNIIEWFAEDGSATFEKIIDTNDYTDTTPDYASAGWGVEPASINYTGFIAYLVKGIQELKYAIELQTTEITSLAA